MTSNGCLIAFSLLFGAILIALDRAGVPFPPWYILIPMVIVVGTASFIGLACLLGLIAARRHPIDQDFLDQSKNKK
jgi:hypothetical protein